RERPRPRRLPGRAADRARGVAGRHPHPGRAAAGAMSEGELLAEVRKVVHGALAALEAARDRINDLNVYPVPDGDTGTNLSLSLRSVAEAVDHAEPAPAPALAKVVSLAALMGARGNSGVILSQIVRGFCEGVA